MTEKQPQDWTPHEGEEGKAADPPPPVRYEGQTPAPAQPSDAAQPSGASAPAPTSGPVESHRTSGAALEKRLAAVAGPLALVLFMVCGFAFDGWAWAWIFFLLPGIVYAWNRAGHDD